MKKVNYKLQHKLGFALIILFSATYIFSVLWYNGIIWPNTPSKNKYPVRGVDVSSYQGEIDWEVIESQDIDFAFIKATEGSGYADEYFSENFENAAKTNIRIGAYHFFSFDSPGKTQAENYIKTVPKVENMLPPVIDLEYYNGYGANPPDSSTTRENLYDIISILEDYYGMPPIIYVTEVTYNRYIKGYFEENDIWIRSIFKKASLPDGRNWAFWQYCHRGRLKGYDGIEKYIDLNVFSGSREDFYNYYG